MVIVMLKRRLLSAVAVLGLVFAGLMAGPVSAGAAATTSAASGNCPGSQYPPQQATIMASTTTPNINQTIEVSGINYCPNEDVTLTIRGQYVGTAHTDSQGSFDPPVVVPGPAGQAVLEGVGASGLPTDKDSLILTIRGTTPAGGSETTVPGGGGLSHTGVAVAGLIAIAVVLLGGGALLSGAGRRRRAGTHS
jgi:hypothetical protein